MCSLLINHIFVHIFFKAKKKTNQLLQLSKTVNNLSITLGIFLTAFTAQFFLWHHS